MSQKPPLSQGSSSNKDNNDDGQLNEKDFDTRPPAPEKMSILQTSLALVATDIGAALLSLPYALYRVGFINGLIFLFFMALASYFSNMMYLRVKNLTPGQFESIYEISYYLLGRPFIFFVNSLVLCTTIASMLLYYIFLGETISHLVRQGFLGETQGRTEAEMETELVNEP